LSKNSARYRVQVLDRAFAILNLLSSGVDDVSPTDLTAQLHLHKSTVHRLLVVLEGQRFIRRTPEGKYGLGMGLIEIGNRAMEQLDLGARATLFLQQLVDDTGETAHISVLSGTEMTSIANSPGRWTLRTPSTVGQRTHVYCTSVGKAVAAFLPPIQLDELISELHFVRCTSRTITTPLLLREELARVRRRGFAVDDEEAEEGLRCIGAPVRNYSGDVVASMSIAGPVFRIRKRQVPELASAVMQAADRLSANLGYRKVSRPA
jgi:DNA-binding IclR family transcriptional regulator